MVVLIWRILLLALNVICVLMLANRFRKYRSEWKTETFNLWATLILWSIAGGEVAIQGIVESTHATARLVFITIASFATPIVLREKTVERRSED